MSSVPPLRAELFRMLRVRSNWLLLLLPPLVGAARVLGGRVGDDLARSRRAIEGADAAGVAAVSGFGPLADGLRTGGAVLTLVVLISGALALVRERENAALGLAFLARSRLAVLLAKALALALFALLGFALLFAGSAGVAGALYGFGAVVEEGYEMASASELWIETAKGSLAVLPALVAAGWFALLVSALAATTGAAVSGALIPFVAFDVLRGLFGDGVRHVFATYVPFLSDGSTLATLTKIARAYSDAGWAPHELLRATCIPGAEGLLLLLAAAIALHARPA